MKQTYAWIGLPNSGCYGREDGTQKFHGNYRSHRYNTEYVPRDFFLLYGGITKRRVSERLSGGYLFQGRCSVTKTPMPVTRGCKPTIRKAEIEVKHAEPVGRWGKDDRKRYNPKDLEKFREQLVINSVRDAVWWLSNRMGIKAACGNKGNPVSGYGLWGRHSRVLNDCGNATFREMETSKRWGHSEMIPLEESNQIKYSLTPTFIKWCEDNGHESHRDDEVFVYMINQGVYLHNQNCIEKAKLDYKTLEYPAICKETKLIEGHYRYQWFEDRREGFGISEDEWRGFTKAVEDIPDYPIEEWNRLMSDKMVWGKKERQFWDDRFNEFLRWKKQDSENEKVEEAESPALDEATIDDIYRNIEPMSMEDISECTKFILDTAVEVKPYENRYHFPFKLLKLYREHSVLKEKVADLENQVNNAKEVKERVRKLLIDTI